MANAPRAHYKGSSKLEADYLVVGAGAMGMAFVDTLLSQLPHATVVLIDKHGQPGGHWNDAYPFVRLHQSASFYGVNSKQLEREKGDYLTLSSRNEILAYYEGVIQEFIDSGRVKYYPMSEWVPGANPRQFRSLAASGQVSEVCHTAKVVDATYMQIKVPSTSGAQERYEVSEDVRGSVIPLNNLPQMHAAFRHYVVVGAGKTGMDAVLWLLNNDVQPECITWIMPRDAWILPREQTTPLGRLENLKTELGLLLDDADNFDDWYKSEFFDSIDPEISPTKNKCATVGKGEMEMLRLVRDRGEIVRKGRVKRVETGNIVLQEGAHAVPQSTLFVDCSAGALDARPVVPVFQDDRITLQAVKVCQQVFSAALIAKVESLTDTIGATDDEKNDLTRPVPHPEIREDLFLGFVTQLQNKEKQEAHPQVKGWLNSARLNNESHAPTLLQTLTWASRNWRDLPYIVSGVYSLLMNGASKTLGSKKALHRAATEALAMRRDSGLGLQSKL